MFSVDLQDGYWQVNMHPDAHTYLAFEWEGQYYVFTVLPFGLATAPWAFTKLMREVCGVLRQRGVRLVNYLDDFLFLVGSKPSQAAAMRQQVLDVMGEAGLRINTAKSQLELSTQVTHLGYDFDSCSGRITVPMGRWQALKGALAAVHGLAVAPARQLAQVTGHLASMGLALGPMARLRTRYLYACLNSRVSWRSRVPICEEARAELRFWASRDREAWGLCVWPLPVWHAEVQVASDASDAAWGGVAPGLQAHGPLPAVARGTSSAYRELLAARCVLQSFVGQVRGRAVTLYTDSQNCSRILAVGSRRPDLQALAVGVVEWCEAQGVRLRAEWVPREENMQADALSKWEDWEDYGAAPWVFTMAQQRWGPHTVDRFASHLAAVLPCFNSRLWCPGSAGVDALAQRWQGSNSWCHPPPRLVGHVVMHVLLQGVEATLLVPWWPFQPWWPLLEPVEGLWASFVADCVVLPDLGVALTPGPSRQALPPLQGARGFLLRLVPGRVGTGSNCLRIPDV
jgi:hypothetical protein